MPVVHVVAVPTQDATDLGRYHFQRLPHVSGQVMQPLIMLHHFLKGLSDGCLHGVVPVLIVASLDCIAESFHWKSFKENSGWGTERCAAGMAWSTLGLAIPIPIPLVTQSQRSRPSQRAILDQTEGLPGRLRWPCHQPDRLAKDQRVDQPADQRVDWPACRELLRA